MRLCYVCHRRVEHPYLVKVLSPSSSIFYHRECFMKEKDHEHAPNKYPHCPPLVDGGGYRPLDG